MNKDFEKLKYWRARQVSEECVYNLVEYNKVAIHRACLRAYSKGWVDSQRQRLHEELKETDNE